MSDERKIHDILHHAVKRSLRESGVLPTPHLSPQAESPTQNMTVDRAAADVTSFRSNKPSAVDQTVLKELYRPDTKPGDPTSTIKPDTIPDDIQPPRPMPAQRSDSADELDVDSALYLGQFAGLYLLFSINDKLFIIDQHAAHERILYESGLKSLESGRATSQNLLFPVNLELAADEYSLYEEAIEELKAIGFVVERFGPRAVLLTAVPSVLSKQSPEKVFKEIIADVHDKCRAGQELTKAIAQTVACRAAVMAGDRITETEARALLTQLCRTENRHSCPHGRPTFLKITKNELEIRFGRK